MRTLLLLVLATALASGSTIASAQITLEACFQCHGENGLGVSDEIPILAGTDIIVLEDALLDYRDGTRACAHMPAMCALAQQLSDEHIADFADYFSGLEFIPADQPFDPALAALGKTIHDDRCARCHGKQDDIDRTAGRLFGQHTAHLRYALAQYRQGLRQALPTMAKKLATLEDDDVESLLHYYASYR